MIKLVVIDLDGTLLNEEKRIPLENMTALKRALQQGIHLSISTGRSYVSGREFAENLSVSVPTSYQNGAVILNHEKKPPEVLRKVLLGNEIATRIVESAKRHGLTATVFRDSFSLPDMLMDRVPDSPYSDYYAKNEFRIRLVDDIREHLNSSGIIEISLEGEESRIITSLSELDLDDSQVTVVKNNEIENHAFYEFLGPGVGKDYALRFLADHLGISLSEVGFIGDNFNDLEAMQVAGLSIAMNNAPDEIKAVVDFVTKSSNDESGVAEAIDLIMAGG
ncbi:MAG TPA: Cof-type HAD-IIB family hydrolase [Kosmotogaceae bacterium]|nr:MAG: Cof-like hydrolase [Thermotogales bacterium 46_20]HAA85123.1 Cof-type HAD-IIB family hydrolase [Kosmotogaceae bacterium]